MFRAIRPLLNINHIPKMTTNNIPAIQEKLYNPNLSAAEIHVMRDKGTERPFTSPFLEHETKPGFVGKYTCKNCDILLYESSTMFDSGCGWPSFHTSAKGNLYPDVANGAEIKGKSGKIGLKDNNIIQYVDNSLGMQRIEVCCLNCDSHLGHIFKGEGWEKVLGKGKNDRYCINGISLNFAEEK